ncbi:MAG: hypothetical protein ACRDMJ_01530, partial [Solirubrobacteraceae bacterium]
MRLLLLGLTGTEPSFQAWRRYLSATGVPFDAVSLNRLQTQLQFTDGDGSARFQGLILADGEAIRIALEPSQRADLERAERELGARRLTAYATPGPECGLAPASWAGPMEQIEAELTPRGREVFPYLRRRLPIDPGSWAFLAPPACDRFEVLVAGPQGSALVGIHCHPDGREEMVQLFDANADQAQGQVLRRGQLAWLTGGTYVGFDRNHLSMQVDDVLMGNHSWSVADHASDRRPQSSLRMRAADAGRVAAWARTRGLRLDLACNGAGAGAGGDPLLAALLAGGQAFGWVNHTYGHANLDRATQAEIEAEIQRNLSWAQTAGVEFEPEALVTGAHTGLANLTSSPPTDENPSLGPALRAQGIRYIACDASRPYPARGGAALLPAGAPFA